MYIDSPQQYASKSSTVAATSVNQQADNALESSSKVHSYAESLLGELRQAVNAEGNACPHRCGIVGKLIDATEHSDTTFKILQEIREYLLG